MPNCLYCGANTRSSDEEIPVCLECIANLLAVLFFRNLASRGWTADSGTMIFVSHDRMFLRGLGSRVLELGRESGTDRSPLVYPGSYIEYVQKTGHEAPGIIH